MLDAELHVFMQRQVEETGLAFGGRNLLQRGGAFRLRGRDGGGRLLRAFAALAFAGALLLWPGFAFRPALGGSLVAARGAFALLGFAFFLALFGAAGGASGFLLRLDCDDDGVILEPEQALQCFFQ